MHIVWPLLNVSVILVVLSISTNYAHNHDIWLPKKWKFLNEHWNDEFGIK